MTALEKQMAEALRDLLAPFSDVHDGSSKQLDKGRQALAKFDAQAAEQAAGGGEAVAWPSAADIADEIDALLPMSVGDSTMAAIEEWWRQLVERKLSKLPITHPAPAAPSEPHVVKHSVTYDEAGAVVKVEAIMSDATAVTVVEVAPAPAPAESPAAPVQQVGELPPLPAGWKFNHARQQTDDDGPVDGVWEIGWLEVDDNYFAPIVTVDTGLYYQDKYAEPLAQAILARLNHASAALAARGEKR